MTGQAEPVRVVVTFSGPNTADGAVTTEGAVNIGQLALAAWLLEAQARDARQGAMVAAAREQAQIATLAAGIRNGGRG